MRTTFTDEQYQTLRRVATHVEWRFEVAIVLAHETGHRIAAIRHLKWSDIDLEEGTVLWRAEQDTSGREHTTPLTADALRVLVASAAATSGHRQHVGDAKQRWHTADQSAVTASVDDGRH